MLGDFQIPSLTDSVVVIKRSLTKIQPQLLHFLNCDCIRAFSNRTYQSVVGATCLISKNPSFLLTIQILPGYDDD